ncbi:hypothetical protein NHX12_031292 [Muraenolepis orangiensis]|uniref:RING-type domain-containing protein n=1 Tax=Muraenolepis orangiensis TaxID=630683 RepID=A0A9Q0E3T6_9TELE|nr:hypothetical protein NHX12_031292 [Muraenolepis orangiensis]
MEFFKHEGAEEPKESDCPVCYDSLSGTERTLSCGHVFCHDCLVRTLVGVTRDGVISDTIVCPMCRHLTFIKKQRDDAVGSPLPSAEKGEPARKEEQTLEVPIREPEDFTRYPGDFTSHPGDFTRYPSALWRATAALGFDWRRWLRRVCAFGRQGRLVVPSLDHSASQVFVISEQGRPMAEEDALSVASAAAVVHQQQPLHARRRRMKICTTGHCLLFLLSIFTILALVAATLPWILLA